jgi:hypothetical protein
MTHKLLPLLAGAAALLAAPAQATPRDGEAELARALQGRVAGEPVDCINLHAVRSSRVIEGTAIIYGSGGTIYVNRPRAGAEDLTRWDTQVTRPFSNRLCSIDTVTMVDPSTRMLSGIVFLGEFVPYRRVRN